MMRSYLVFLLVDLEISGGEGHNFFVVDGY